MLHSSFGKNLNITIAGGSHEAKMTVKISGIPAGETIDMATLQEFLKRRVPGQSEETTPRKETDIVYLRKNGAYTIPEVIITDGSPLEFIIKNENYNTEEYHLTLPRPGHADLPAYLKYGDKVNMSGGGPFSGRMTAMLCVAGGIALQILQRKDINIGSQALSIGQIKNRAVDLVLPEASPISDMMKDEIKFIKEDGNSLGGVIEVFATGVPLGLGGPMYDGVESVLSPIFYGIPGVKGVEFGNGFAASYLMGSENNDDFLAIKDDNRILTATNNHGGILGGITTGMPLIARIGIKPTPSISKSQQTINLKTGQIEYIKLQGRHDPCIVPRALPVAEAALAVGLLDLILENEKNKDDLPSLRQQIDNLDDRIITLLKERMKISKKVALYKLQNNSNILDSNREQKILNKAGEDFKDIYKEIFKESKRLQENIIKDKKGE